ncbi:MAG: hypothetical protein JXR76_16425 [Deltaproteobacteria bacterium]|nr:hypothetical protein [Deltaproteobacteria bacterium]
MSKNESKPNVATCNATSDDNTEIVAKGKATFGTFRWRIAEDDFQFSSPVADLFELSADTVITSFKSLKERVSPKDLERFENGMSEVISGKDSVHLEFLFMTPSGEKYMSLYGDVYRDEFGGPMVLNGFICANSIGSGSERIQYMSDLVCETIHSINNRFTSVLGSSSMAVNLLRDEPMDLLLRKYLEEIENEILQAAAQLRRLVQRTRPL